MQLGLGRVLYAGTFHQERYAKASGGPDQGAAGPGQALENFCDRTGIKHNDALVSTFIQTEKYGTPLAQSLRILARELRDERLMAAEAKAARLPATSMVRMVIFILPVLFIVLIGPGAINILDSLKSV